MATERGVPSKNKRASNNFFFFSVPSSFSRPGHRHLYPFGEPKENKPRTRTEPNRTRTRSNHRITCREAAIRSVLSKCSRDLRVVVVVVVRSTNTGRFCVLVGTSTWNARDRTTNDAKPTRSGEVDRGDTGEKNAAGKATKSSDRCSIDFHVGMHRVGTG